MSGRWWLRSPFDRLRVSGKGRGRWTLAPTVRLRSGRTDDAAAGPCTCSSSFWSTRTRVWCLTEGYLLRTGRKGVWGSGPDENGLRNGLLIAKEPRRPSRQTAEVTPCEIGAA